MHIHSTTYTDIARICDNESVDIQAIGITGEDIAGHTITVIGVREYTGLVVEYDFLSIDTKGDEDTRTQWLGGKGWGHYGTNSMRNALDSLTHRMVTHAGSF